MLMLGPEGPGQVDRWEGRRGSWRASDREGPWQAWQPQLQSDLVMWGLPGGSGGKESACNAGDLGLIPRWERSPGEGNGYPVQYSCLENSHGQRSLAGYCFLVSGTWTFLNLVQNSCSL